MEQTWHWYSKHIITPRKETVTSFLTFLGILWFCCIIYHIYHHITCDTTGKVAREVGEIGPWRCLSYFVSLILESRFKVRKMAVRANTYRVNVICILILIMIRFSYTKRLNEVKTDGLNTEEVYGLCLLGKKNFVLLLMRVPKLPRKSLIFLLLLIFADIE